MYLPPPSLNTEEEFQSVRQTVKPEIQVLRAEGGRGANLPSKPSLGNFTKCN